MKLSSSSNLNEGFLIFWDRRLSQEYISEGIIERSETLPGAYLHFVSKQCREIERKSENVKFQHSFTDAVLEKKQLVWIENIFRALSSFKRISSTVFENSDIDLLDSALVQVFFDIKEHFQLALTIATLRKQYDYSKWIFHMPAQEPRYRNLITKWGAAEGIDIEVVSERSGGVLVEIPEVFRRMLYRLKEGIADWISSNRAGIVVPENAEVLGFDNYVNGSKHTCPVLQDLAKVHGIRVHYLTGRRRIVNSLRECHVAKETVSFDSGLSRVPRKLSRPMQTEIWSALDRLPNEVWKIDGVHLAELLKPIVFDSLSRRLCEANESYIRLRRHFLSGTLTAVVLGSSTDISSRLLESMAKITSVVSICVQHGLYTDSALMRTFRPDYFLVWGVGFKNMLSKFVGPSQKIVVIGSCVHEFTENSKRSPVANNAKLRFLYAPSRIGGSVISESESREAMGKVVRHAREHQDIEWVVKLHPTDKGRSIKEWFDCWPQNIEIINRGNVGSIIDTCSVVVVQTSSVGYETILKKKPLVVLCVEVDQRFGFMDKKYSFIAKSYSDLVVGLQQATLQASEGRWGSSRLPEEGRRYWFAADKTQAIQNASSLIKGIVQKNSINLENQRTDE